MLYASAAQVSGINAGLLRRIICAKGTPASATVAVGALNKQSGVRRRLSTSTVLADIAQSRSSPVNEDMAAGLHPVIAVTHAPAAHQFDLQVVQRV